MNRHKSLGLRVLSYLGVLLLGATLALALAPRFQTSSTRLDYCGYGPGNLWDMFGNEGFDGTLMPQLHAIDGFCEVAITLAAVHGSATIAVSDCKGCLVAAGFGNTYEEEVIYVSSRQISLNPVVMPYGTYSAQTAYLLYPAQLWDGHASAPDRGSVQAILGQPDYYASTSVPVVQASDVNPRLPEVPVASSLQSAVAQAS